MKTYRVRFLLLVACSLGAVLLPGGSVQSSPALDPPPINELCLSDDEFVNVTTLTLDQIQAFLKAQGGFLKGRIKDVDGVEIDPAEELFNAAQTFQINPQVLLTTLQKEQSAVTRPRRLLDTRLRLLMGFDPEHRVVPLREKSIREQIRDAAAQFRRDLDRLSRGEPTAGGWQVGVPKETLDLITVTPASKAAAVLYSYTPWVGRAFGGRPDKGGNGLFCQLWEQFGFKKVEKRVGLPITAGFLHTCALRLDSTAKCWGRNNFGQLGNGAFSEFSSTPVAVVGLTSATTVAAGGVHTCGLIVDRTVQCWGKNVFGQLGNGTTTDSATPTAVSTISTAMAVAGGDDYTCAVLAEGVIKCWGLNRFGQLGNGAVTGFAPNTTPVLVSLISTATGVTAALRHTCAVLADGTARCWGDNRTGQLGIGTFGGFSAVPVPVTGLTNAIAISATTISAGAGSALEAHTCALLADGRIRCWGDNSSGQLGTGTTTDSSTPAAVSGISTAIAIAAGSFHTCGLLADGTVKCWGANFRGQLGTGTLTDSSTPVTVSGLTTAVAIATGGLHTCARLADGTVRCWGDNGAGQLGDGTTASALIPVAVVGF